MKMLTIDVPEAWLALDDAKLADRVRPKLAAKKKETESAYYEARMCAAIKLGVATTVGGKTYISKSKACEALGISYSQLKKLMERSERPRNAA